MWTSSLRWRIFSPNNSFKMNHSQIVLEALIREIERGRGGGGETDKQKVRMREECGKRSMEVKNSTKQFYADFL